MIEGDIDFEGILVGQLGDAGCLLVLDHVHAGNESGHDYEDQQENLGADFHPGGQ